MTQATKQSKILIQKTNVYENGDPLLSYHSKNKKRLHKGLYQFAKSELNAKDIFAQDLVWRGSCPLDEHRGLARFEQMVWQPLKESLPDIERRDFILLSGESFGNHFVACLGVYAGSFVRPWLSIPPTGKTALIHYGEIYRIGKDGRIVEAWCLWDILGVIRQSGFWPLGPMLGAEALWLPPITADGISFADKDERLSNESIVQTLEMHKSLAEIEDREDLSVEKLIHSRQKNYWHSKMMWYGPQGIGATRGLPGFVKGHQLPFRTAFPNRKGGRQWDDVPDKKAQYGGGHYICLGDGHYSVTGGWPSVIARHEGGDFMGLAPTGREVTMRVMDFYNHVEGKIRENWVPLDILDLLRQMGIDVFERLADSFERVGKF